MKAFNLTLLAIFAVIIGIYPLVYLLVEMDQGLLASKPTSVLKNDFWRWSFYTHIYFGGITLLTGWSQFIDALRVNKPKIHRALGTVYVVSVCLSGFGALFSAFYASGGLISAFGFGLLAISWLFTTWMAYTSIKKGKISVHKKWMIRSFALTFAAVTLRIWLPFMQFGLSWDFQVSYQIVAWLCWVPNLFVAEWIVRARQRV